MPLDQISKITPERWQQIKPLLCDALEREDKGEREAFLARACGNDFALRREVESFLEPFTDNVEAFANNLRTTLGRHICSESAGRRLGAYKIISEIGCGGMGTVFLAARADGQFEKQVAIKVLKRGTDTDEVVRRFRAEKQILAQLEHQSIARLLDAGTTDDGLPYFVMELVAGKTITRFVRELQLSIRQRLDLFLKVCSAVERAHRENIVHRDLKPSNILVTPDGEPKLLDFGIAKLLEPGKDAVEATATNQQRFTPTCASPEQARGERVTIASDIYALGALLYEMLVDRGPHNFANSRPTSEELARVVCEQEPKAPSAVASDPETRSQLRGDLDNIVAMAMRKDPKRRYSSVAELAEDVGRYLNATPVQARLGTNGQRVLASKRRRHLRVGLALAAAAFVLVLGILFTIEHRRGVTLSGAYSPSVASIHTLAVLPFESLAHNGPNELWGLGMADAVIGRLSGLKKLTVLPTVAIARLKGANGDAIATGLDLHVDAVLCGTVQRSSDRVRVSVQLVSVGTRQTLWSTKFDEIFTDVFDVQDSISREVARALTVNLSPDDQKQLAKHNTSNTGAYDLYLLGLTSYNQRTKEGLVSAIGYFQKAIETDPNYALAYALMSDCYFLQGYYKYRPSRETSSAAKAAAEQALRIDSSLAEGYLALAMVQPMTDAPATERLLRRAIDLNPNFALAHQRYSWRLCAKGDLNQALLEMKLAQQLDPLSSTNDSALGIQYLFARQFDLGIHYCEKAAELNPNEPFIQSNLGGAYLVGGRFQEAIERFRKSTELNPELYGDNLASIALAFSREGKIDEATRMMGEILKLSAEGKVEPYNLALLYAARGDKDEAFQWFARFLQKDREGVGLIRYDSLLDPLRSDAHFNELLVRYDPTMSISSSSQ